MVGQTRGISKNRAHSGIGNIKVPTSNTTQIKTLMTRGWKCQEANNRGLRVQLHPKSLSALAYAIPYL